MNGSSTNRCGGSVPVHTALMIRPAESVTASTLHPGTSANEMIRTLAGNSSSTRVVAVAFSFGTRSAYRSYAPGGDERGYITAWASAATGTSVARRALTALTRIGRHVHRRLMVPPPVPTPFA